VVGEVYYENLGEVCVQAGFDAYIPHRYGDPKLVAGRTAHEIDRIDRLAVTQSCLVVAYVGIASTGTGIEIELAHHANKPVILLYEQKRLEERRVSRLVRGNPAVRTEIAFDTFDDALVSLAAAVKQFRAEFEAEGLPEPLSLG
jgi:nucleoside 2-deoxyribosyltransferase